MASPGSVVVQFIAKADEARRDVLDFAKGLGKVDDAADDTDSALSDVQRALDKVGDEAKRTDMDSVAKGFDEVGDEAERAADRLRRAARDMADGVDDGARKIDTETDGIKTSMGETGREAGAEFIGNLAEGIGSGTANVNEVAQGTLGGLTNLAATLGGPLGLAVGAAAGGIGLVFAAVTGAAKKAQEQVDSISAALVELGETSSDAAKQARWDEWMAGFEDGDKTVSAIVDALDEAKVPTGLFKEAMTGSLDAQEQILALTQPLIKKLEDQEKKGDALNRGEQNRLNNLRLVSAQLGVGNDALDEANDQLNDINRLTGDNVGKQKEYNDKLAASAQKARELGAALDEATKDRDVKVRVSLEGGATMGEALNNYWGRSAPAAAAMAVQPVVVNVHTSGPTIPNSPRAVRALLDSHDLRMGRLPGTPRARAW